MRIVLTRREALDSPDGVNIFIVSLAQALSDLGHEIRVVVGSLQSPSEYRRLLAPRLDLPILARHFSLRCLTTGPRPQPALLGCRFAGAIVCDSRPPRQPVST